MAQEILEQIFSGQVTQKVLIEKDGKVLVSRDYDATNWDLPGGRIHLGEDPTTGLAREVQEEIGIEVIIGKPFYTDVFTFSPRGTKSPGQNCFLVAYHATLKDPSQPFVLASDEIGEVKWVSKSDIAALPMWPEYKRTLEVFFNLSDK